VPTGTLSIDTEPVKGEVLVDGVSWGIAPVSQVVDVGTYTVSFGDVTDYITPADITATVSEDTVTTVTGIYIVVTPTLGWIEGTVTDVSTGLAIELATVEAVGPDTVSVTTNATGYYNTGGLTIGTYTVTASAAGYQTASQTDVTVFAGETTTIDFTLTPTPFTIDSLIAQVEDFYEQGKIDESEIKTSLVDKLYAAKAKIDQAKTKTAKNILNAFINHLEAQSGKHVTEEAADTLIVGAQYIIGNL